MPRPVALITGPAPGIAPRRCVARQVVDVMAVIQLTRAELPAPLAAGAGTGGRTPRNLAHAPADRVGGGRGRS